MGEVRAPNRLNEVQISYGFRLHLISSNKRTNSVSLKITGRRDGWVLAQEKWILSETFAVTHICPQGPRSLRTAHRALVPQGWQLLAGELLPPDYDGKSPCKT